MTPTIIQCEQGTEEWLRARMGIPTASEFSCLLASGKGGGESKTRKTYMYKLAGERITGEPMERFSNHHTDRGHAMESEAREMYCMLNDCDAEQVGFIQTRSQLDGFTHDLCGASPDSLIGDNGLLEIKTKLPHIQIEVLLSGSVPTEHMAQLQGELMVSGREWVDLCCYWPGIKPFIQRVYRDELYIKKLTDAVRVFNLELHEIVRKVAA